MTPVHSTIIQCTCIIIIVKIYLNRYLPIGDILKILTYLIWALWAHVTYLFTKCVTKSCDLPVQLIQSCINRHHHMSMEHIWQDYVQNFFKIVLSVESINLLSLNTIIHNHCYGFAIKCGSMMQTDHFPPLTAQACYSKDQPVCYDTSHLKNGFYVNTRYALLKTLAFKSNMRGTVINNSSVETSSHLW